MLIFHFFHPTQDFKAQSSKAYLVFLAQKHHWGRVSYTPSGKPMVSLGYVSISHTHQQLIIAYERNQSIGIDLEYPRLISSNLIQRLNLDPHDPLLSWCKKEALIKLLDDPSKLFDPLDKRISFKRIPQENKAYLMVASHSLIHDYQEIFIHLNAND